MKLPLSSLVHFHPNFIFTNIVIHQPPPVAPTPRYLRHATQMERLLVASTELEDGGGLFWMNDNWLRNISSCFTSDPAGPRHAPCRYRATRARAGRCPAQLRALQVAMTATRLPVLQPELASAARLLRRGPGEPAEKSQS